MVHDVSSAESNSYLPIFLCRMMHAHKFLSNRVLYALFVFLSPLHRFSFRLILLFHYPSNRRVGPTALSRGLKRFGLVKKMIAKPFLRQQ